MDSRKCFVLISTVVFVLGVVLTSGAGAGTKVLKYSDHDPPHGPRYESLVAWFKEIEKQTSGRVKVKSFFGGAMGKSRESLKMVSEGTVDMAFVYPGHFPKQLIASNVFPLFPQGPSKWENIKWVYEKILYDIPAFSDEYAKENQKVVYITERCVFQLIDGKLTLTEIAEGIKPECDLYPMMEFKPVVAEKIRIMPKEIFFEKWGALKAMIETQ